MDYYQERQFREFVLGFVFSVRLSKVNDTGSRILLVSLVESIKTYLVVMLSYRKGGLYK